ncbi:hypothetical protein BDR06DRAFT_1005947 [Suillus hirtellus]|nr:hypothetical protein BDR06DRAFT_1005947 [Suillus hirtellus]
MAAILEFVADMVEVVVMAWGSESVGGVVNLEVEGVDMATLGVLLWVLVLFDRRCCFTILDDVNNTAKRRDRNKILPHGVPNLIYDSPEDFGTLDFKVSIDREGIDYVRNFYIDVSNPVFDLVPPRLRDFIEHCYDAMGRPAVTRSSVWNVYRNVLSAVQLAENPPRNLLLTENEDAPTDALPLIGGHTDLPFNKESDGMYYMGGVRGGLGLGDSHIHDLDALAELDEPNVASDNDPIEDDVDHTALIVWQFSSDESENDGITDEW